MLHLSWKYIKIKKESKTFSSIKILRTSFINASKKETSSLFFLFFPLSIYFILYWSLLVGQVMNSLLSRSPWRRVLQPRSIIYHLSDLLCCGSCCNNVLQGIDSGREAPLLSFLSDLVIIMKCVEVLLYNIYRKQLPFFFYYYLPNNDGKKKENLLTFYNSTNWSADG